MTILIYAIVLIYGTSKFTKVKDRSDTSFETKLHRNALSETETFTFEELGANFAFGFRGLTQDEALYYFTIQAVVYE